jgi:hypothetical protein
VFRLHFAGRLGATKALEGLFFKRALALKGHRNVRPSGAFFASKFLEDRASSVVCCEKNPS